MKIIDGKRILEIPDNDPVVAQIRTLLYRQSVSDPVQVLWDRASGPLRDVLVAIAKSGDIGQIELECALGIDGIGLRGRNAALARVAKAIGVEYPIRKTGGRREHRRFSLEPGVSNEVLRLASSN